MKKRLHYYTLSIEGAVVADPATRTFFGSGFYNSAIEIPEPEADGDYSLKDVPRGVVRRRWYQSKVTGNQEHLLRVARHGTCVADVAALLQGIRSDVVPLVNCRLT